MTKARCWPACGTCTKVAANSVAPQYRKVARVSPSGWRIEGRVIAKC